MKLPADPTERAKIFRAIVALLRLPPEKRKEILSAAMLKRELRQKPGK